MISIRDDSSYIFEFDITSDQVLDAIFFVLDGPDYSLRWELKDKHVRLSPMKKKMQTGHHPCRIEYIYNDRLFSGFDEVLEISSDQSRIDVFSDSLLKKTQKIMIELKEKKYPITVQISEVQRI